MNDMNVFQRRAQNRNMDKFSNVTEYPTSVLEEENESSENVFQRRAAKNIEKENQKFGFLETARDVGEQVTSKVVSGIGGAYGNIQQTFNLAPEIPDQISPAQKEMYSQQNQVFEKLDRGEIPSFTELMSLSDDDILPRGSRLPTSKEINQKIKDKTGVGEGKTPAGRIAGQGAEFFGEGLALGGGAKALSVLTGSGLAGQSIREAEGPEALATGIEIGVPLLHGGLQGRVNPRNARDSRFVQSARNMGFNEREITPLIQGPKKIATLKPIARKGTKTQELFENISNGAGQIYSQITQMPNAQSAISPQNTNRLNTAFQTIRNNLANTLQPSPDKQSALNFIDGAISELQTNGATPERLINFWQDINSAVNWNSLTGGRKQLSALKEPISNAIESVSPQINRYFTDINELYSRFKNISNKLKPDIVDSFLNKGEMVSAIPAGLSLVYGNPTPLMGIAGEVSTRILAREMLINPYFQNVANKLVTNFNAGSVKGITDIVNQVQDYMNRKHPEHDWSFLTEPQDENN